MDMTCLVGKTVLFYPGIKHREHEFSGKLNGAEFLPAIVTQILSGGLYCNLTVFSPYGLMHMFTVAHRNEETKNGSYWILKDEK